MLRRIAVGILCLAAQACSREAPPAPVIVTKAPPPVAAPPSLPPSRTNVPDSFVQPAPDTRTNVPDSFVQPAPGRPAPLYASPTFTFEILPAGAAEVFLNGERAGKTPFRWFVSPQTEFDPSIPVQEWPPAGTRRAAQGRFRTDEGFWTSMEVRIAGGKYPGEELEELRRRFPLFQADEHVLFVRAELPGQRVVQGALRLRIPGHRFVHYLPTHLTEESPDFQRYSRALWFEPDS